LLDGRLIQELTRLEVAGQQHFDLATERRVPTASLFQISSAVGRVGQFQNSLKNLFFRHNENPPRLLVLFTLNARFRPKAGHNGSFFS
jgi:hypothetical protein